MTETGITLIGEAAKEYVKFKYFETILSNCIPLIIFGMFIGGILYICKKIPK